MLIKWRRFSGHLYEYSLSDKYYTGKNQQSFRIIVRNMIHSTLTRLYLSA